MNLSYLSATTNSKKKINRKIKFNNYTTKNNNSINPIRYNIRPKNDRKRQFSSENNNIKTYSFNKNKSDILNKNNNILKKIRERIINKFF